MGEVSAEYVPGEFYRREMPSILTLIKAIKTELLEVLVIDGYVDLAKDRPGLGRHLSQALHADLPIIGVAKNRFNGSDAHVEVLRGTSKKPLYVTSCGMAVDRAAECIRSMHGQFRIPTMLKRVDRLARDGA
jgi:deoxyribonuclease V